MRLLMCRQEPTILWAEDFLCRTCLTPSITYSLDTLNTYYNKDGTLAYQSTGISNKTVSYITNYVYDSSFTDTNGKQYSYVKLQSPLTYGFTGSFFKNYSLYMGPSVDTTYLNKSFSIRDNIVYATGDYRFILNSNIFPRLKAGNSTYKCP